jgi:hypothetical protein
MREEQGQEKKNGKAVAEPGRSVLTAADSHKTAAKAGALFRTVGSASKQSGLMETGSKIRLF